MKNQQHQMTGFFACVMTPVTLLMVASSCFASTPPVAANTSAASHKMLTVAANTSDTATNTNSDTPKTAGAAASESAAAALDATTAVNATTAADDVPQDATPAPENKPVQTADPLEGFNRAMFTFNDKLDTFVLKPVATLYNKIMPKPLNQGIHNFFNNLGEVPTIANDILQFNFYQMANDLWRLGINTTVGIGGLFDIASRMQLDYYANDFGLTLAKWGWRKSTYLVLPFFGPNTLRDGIEIPVDYYAFSVYPYIEPTSTRYAIYGLGVVDRRAQLLQFQSVLEEAAIDKYIFIRNAYMQRRAYQIEQTDHRSYGDQIKAKMASHCTEAAS